MNQVREVVELPNVNQQLLVHPLDVADARGMFRNAWLIAELTSPAAALGVAAVIWYLSGSFVIPLIAAVVLVVAGTLSTTLLRAESWAFIPRRRQDRSRPLPGTWQLSSGLLVGSLLVVSVVLVSLRLAESGVPNDVRELTFGMAVGAGLIVAIDLLARMRRPSSVTTPMSAIPVVFALVSCVAIAYRALFGSGAFVVDGLAVWGAFTMIAVGAVYALWPRIAGRRGRDRGR
ncbi:MAG TPA: hypothetical protein VJS19_03610 [Candidatus Dormibacteraeota bacterium]|nr:hypothetical protein [Candidatus Dormibacteraeota bacterium]